MDDLPSLDAPWSSSHTAISKPYHSLQQAVWMENRGPVGFSLLPQEVVDNVIDQLAVKRPNSMGPRWRQYKISVAALVACTLVCRAWLPRSSTYVLQNIRVRCNRLDGQATALNQLLAQAKSSPRLCLNARALYVPHMIDELSLAHALEVLSELSSIYFVASDLRPPAITDAADSAQHVPPPIRNRYNLDRLDFERFYIPCALRYLALFQSIDSLRLVTLCSHPSIELSDVSDLQVPDGTHDLRLTTFSMGADVASLVLRFLQPMLAPGTLRSLHLDDLVTNDCRFVEPFLQEACSCLVSFHAKARMLVWERMRTNYDPKAVLPLRSCSQLSTVELVIDRDTTCSVAEFRKFARFACSLALGDLPPSVRHLKVVFNPKLPDFRNPVFDPIMRNISKAVKACEALETVEFVGKMGWADEEGWTLTACRDFLISRFFSQNGHAVNVAEPPSRIGG